LILAFIILFELKTLDAKSIAALSTLSALGGVLRIPFAAIPGLQPTTFIVAVTGYTMGSISGFIVGAMAPFISNFFLGHGPWTLWQMLGWGLCGFFFGLVKKLIKRDNILLFTVLCGIWGYIYGIILDMWYIVAFIKAFDIKSIAVGVSASLYFDTIHAVGNVVFSMLLARSFIHTLSRFNKRYTIEYLDENY
jgi:energy-coupling factor transport system substrate-specific component